MPDLAALEALLEKLVDASVPSREIDATLDKAIYGWAHERTAFPVDVLEKFPQTITLPTVPHFTGSIDAAIALVKHAVPRRHCDLRHRRRYTTPSTVEW